jgi:hypothetical protein
MNKKSQNEPYKKRVKIVQLRGSEFSELLPTAKNVIVVLGLKYLYDQWHLATFLPLAMDERRLQRGARTTDFPIRHRPIKLKRPNQYKEKRFLSTGRSVAERSVSDCMMLTQPTKI